MKKFLEGLLGVCVLAIVLNVALWPSTKPLWAQASVWIYGSPDGGISKVPFKTDVLGNIYIGNTGFSMTGATFSGGALNVFFSDVPSVTIKNNAAYAFSEITTSLNSPVQALSANSNRRAFFIQNDSGADIYWGTVSPVNSATSMTLHNGTGAGIRFWAEVNPPNGAIYVKGSSGVAQTVTVGEGQ